MTGSDQCSNTQPPTLSLLSYVTFPGMSSAPTGENTHIPVREMNLKRAQGAGVICTPVCQGGLRTCGFGPGVDEGSDAAVSHLLVAGVEVNAVHGEGLEVGDL